MSVPPHAVLTGHLDDCLKAGDYEGAEKTLVLVQKNYQFLKANGNGK